MKIAEITSLSYTSKSELFASDRDNNQDDNHDDIEQRRTQDPRRQSCEITTVIRQGRPRRHGASWAGLLLVCQLHVSGNPADREGMAAVDPAARQLGDYCLPD